MKLIGSLPLALLLAFAMQPSARAQSASGQLATFDANTITGYLEAHVSRYAPPDKAGKYPAPDVYPVTVLFERPDRFRIALRPGAKDEYRAVAEGGTVRWLDMGTGLYGKDSVAERVDPLALALLDSVGELSRLIAAKDLPLQKDAVVSVARAAPMVWGTDIAQVLAFFAPDGQPAGFEFTMRDGSRLFFAVNRFEHNPKTSDKDFAL